jgi:hypothetical protein
MKVSFFETARYLAPEPFRPEWSVPSGADDRGAGAQAYQGMIERLGTPAEVRQRREELVAMGGNHLRLNPVCRYAAQVEALGAIVALT